ncbi:amidohydrolase family protein [Chloroflexota bacterium]
MFIDAYSHMFHKTYIARLNDIGGSWATEKVDEAEGIIRRKPQIIDVEERLAQLYRNEIDFQVVTPPHLLYSCLLPDEPATQIALAQIINDGMARLMEESKGRLIGCGTISPAGFEQGGWKEMERAIKVLGLKAMSLPSNYLGIPLDAPEFLPIWEKASEMEVPIYIHPNDPVSHKDRSYEAEYDLMHNFGWPFETVLALSRLVFSGIMERHPSLKIISHHLGGGIPFFWERTDETYSTEGERQTISLILTKPLFEYFSLFYYDTAVGGSSAAIRCAYDVFGADRLVFATDAPFGPGTGENRLATYPKAIKSLNLPEIDNGKILAGNIQGVLNLDLR